jgi:hypothetical protein
MTRQQDNLKQNDNRELKTAPLELLLRYVYGTGTRTTQTGSEGQWQEVRDTSSGARYVFKILIY